MANEITFLYYLRVYEIGTYYYYYVDTNGAVAVTTTKTPIEFSPDGWNNSKLRWERGFTYFGIMRSYSNTLRFVKDGAKILDSIFFSQGTSGKCELFIEQLNTSTASYGYEDYFKGEIDFYKYKNEQYFTTVEIMEGGFTAKLKAYENTGVEIPVADNADGVWVRLHPCNLQFRQKWLTVQSEDVNLYPTYSPSTDEGVNLYLGIYTQDYSGATIELITNLHSAPVTVNLSHYYNYYFFVPATTTIGAPYQPQVKYAIIDSTNTLVGTNMVGVGANIASNSGAYLTGTDLNNPVTLNPGDKCLVWVQLAKTTGAPGYVNDASYYCTQIDSVLQLEMDNLTPEKYIKCLKPRTLFEAVGLDISSNTHFDSTLLTTHEDKLITCGDAVRNLEKSVMKVSMSDLTKSFFGALAAGMKYNRVTDEARIEAITDLFVNTNTATLTNVSNARVRPFTDLLFSTLKVGYDDQTTDSVNGKYEHNNEAVFKSPLYRATDIKDWKSPILASMYPIILDALNLDGQISTDSENDSKLYWLHADIAAGYAGTIPAGLLGAGNFYYNLYINPSLTIDNVYSPSTVFNVFFTPKRCLLRMGQLLASLLYGQGTEYLTFQYNSKSTYNALKMKTDDGTTIIDEGGDELISTLGDAIFQPFLIELDLVSPSGISDLMDTAEYGYFDFEYNGSAFKGYVISAECNAANPEKQTWTLLSHPDNDLTLLK